MVQLLLKYKLFLPKIIPYCHITPYCQAYWFIQEKLKYISRNGLVFIVLLATLFTMAKNGKNPNTHQEEWGNKLWHFLAIKRKWNIDIHENRKNLQNHYPEWKEDKYRRIHTVRVHSDVVLEQVKLIYSDRDQISGYLEWSLYGELTAMDKMDLLEGDESSIIVM